MNINIQIIQGRAVSTIMAAASYLLFSLLAVPLAQAEADFTNSLGMEFIKIKASCFEMGRNGDRKDGENDELPQHTVCITKPFLLGKTEVTVGQFKQFVNDSNYGQLLSDDFARANNQGDNAAVSYISWFDAQAFIHWLNTKEEGHYYRLPSEAEWEYAARAGTTTIYSWGNSKRDADRYAWYDFNALYAGNRHAHVVALKQPNSWGLFDIHGNVWEWVQDWYDVDFYQKSPQNDPTGSDSGKYRVVRGGSWYVFTRAQRSADRNNILPDNRLNSYGFRLLRMLEIK